MPCTTREYPKGSGNDGGLKCQGQIIAVIGGTCSGKTTTSKLIEQAFNNTKYINMEAGHGATLVNPFKINEIRDKIKNKTIDKILYPIGRMIYGFDMLLRAYFTVLPLKLKGKIVICDRYYDIHWIKPLMPAPNVIILIKPSLKLLKKYKREEISMKQLLQERKEADKIFKRLKKSNRGLASFLIFD
jgi:hypothetical protein